MRALHLWVLAKKDGVLCIWAGTPILRFTLRSVVHGDGPDGYTCMFLQCTTYAMNT